jgi:hypothetical protein
MEGSSTFSRRVEESSVMQCDLCNVMEGYFKMMVKTSFLILFVSERIDHLRTILRGLWEAACMETGEYQT